MTKYTLVGDIKHPGRVEVEADTPNDAIVKAEAGDFAVHDEQHDCLAFDWNGDVSTIEKLFEPEDAEPPE